MRSASRVDHFPCTARLAQQECRETLLVEYQAGLADFAPDSGIRQGPGEIALEVNHHFAEIELQEFQRTAVCGRVMPAFSMVSLQRPAGHAGRQEVEVELHRYPGHARHRPAAFLTATGHR